MKIKNLLGNRIVHNAGWLIGGKVANKVIALIVSILTARYLGPDNFGLINYAAAYTAFFASLCTLGINSVLVNDFVESPDEVGETIGTTIVLRAISSLMSAVVIICIVHVVDRNEPLTILVVALSTIGMFFQILDTFNYWFQSRLESKYAAIASVIAYAGYSAYNIILLIARKSVAWFAIGTALEYVLLGIVLLIAYVLRKGPKLGFSWRKGKQLLRRSYPFIIAGMMAAIYANTDKLMLKQMMDTSAVAFYSLASSLSVAWAFVLSAIIDSLYPGIAESYLSDRAVFEKRNRQLYGIVFYLSTFVSLLIMLIAPLLIDILYGRSYQPAVAPLRIVVWYTAFSYLGVARNAWLGCEDRQRYSIYLYVGAAAANVLLNIAFIPLWGAAGAAAASLMTEACSIIVFPALIRPLRPNVRLMVEAIMLKDVRDSVRGKGDNQS